MSNIHFKYFILCLASLWTSYSSAETFSVASQDEFYTAIGNAEANDSIIWKPGTYSDVYMIVSKNNLYIGAETLGATIFNGSSRVRINSDFITFEGFQYIGGDIGTDDIIDNRGSNNHFTQLNLQAYTCYKYMRIREECQYVKITYCNFENRLNLDDQNILSVLVDRNNPGYHKIQHCSFKNFEGSGNDLGIEPIRIGLSTQADFISRTLVECCYFTNCNGDGELISNKARQNVFRFNTFENNPLAELVLRHGSEAIVYANFFLNGKGGVRVREGQDHYIYNNYFQGLSDRALFLQNEASDPLDNINIAFNTILECDEIDLGGNGTNEATNVTFANNIFDQPNDDLFEDATGNETWIGNIANGNLGISLPSEGINVIDPRLQENSEGFYGISSDSPAIDAAVSGFAPLPQYEGMDPIDTDISFDLMQQVRPTPIAEKDLGCNEFPHNITIQPIATEENTGPSYNTNPPSDTDEIQSVSEWIQFFPNPAVDHIELNISTSHLAQVNITIIDMEGKLVSTLYNQTILPGENKIHKNLNNIPTGIYTLRAIRISSHNQKEEATSLKLVKL